MNSYRSTRTIWTCGMLLLGLLTFNALACQAQNLPLAYSSNVSCITSNFNGTAINAGDYIWFTSVFKAHGAGNSAAQLAFSNSSITFTANGVPYNVSVPDSVISMDPNTAEATITFNNSDWILSTQLPNQLAGNIMLDAVSLQLPSNFPGGVSPVQWCGIFSSTSPAVTVNWQWAAAVYTVFSTDNNSLAVKPVDDNQASGYKNSDHAGTPENFRNVVTGGARGGGGANFTGSYSGTAASDPLIIHNPAATPSPTPIPTPVPSPTG